MILSHLDLLVVVGLLFSMAFCMGLVQGAAAHQEAGPTFVDVDGELTGMRAEFLEDGREPVDHPGVPDWLDQRVVEFHVLPEPMHSQVSAALRQAMVGVVLGVARVSFHIANGGIVVGHALAQWIPAVMVGWIATSVGYLATGGFVIWKLAQVYRFAEVTV